MSDENRALRERLLSLFRIEAAERLQALSTGLLGLEHSVPGEGRDRLLEGVFREAHSLKGAARSVDLIETEAVSHTLENVLAALKAGVLAPDPATVDILLEALESLAGEITRATEEATSDAGVPSARLGRSREALEALIAPGAPSPGGPTATLPEGPVEEAAASPAESPGESPLEPVTPQMVRIEAGRLDALLYRIEELTGAKAAAGRRAQEMSELAGDLAAWHDHHGAGESRRSAEQTDAWARALREKAAGFARTAEADHLALAGTIDALLEDTKRAVTVPAASLLESIPAMVRSLARERGKEVETILRGGETAVDRRILEQMKDPLIHLVRNAVDHGIEPPEERVRKGKPPRGSLAVDVTALGGDTFEIAVRDDGAGIAAAGVAGAAMRLGLAPDAQAAAADAASLIFHSGVSTSPTVTDISGRGLGLAIVRDKVERLGGSITLNTELDGGTEFRATLPLSLAAFRGLTVHAGGRPFVLPTTGLDRVARVHASEVGSVEGEDSVMVGEVRLPLLYLDALLGLPRPAAADADAHLLFAVVGTGGRKIALVVDAVDGEGEVLVRSLGRQLGRLPGIGGAALTADGDVVPVLLLSELVSAALSGARISREPAEQARPSHESLLSVLVVEDSITSRTLLKNVLQFAGYHVTTAVDGINALTILATEPVDLVISDVEMPRMDGFELTRRIREHDRNPDLPVILVTALQSTEDRERGIDAGANAYIVKSSFDQSDLLAVVRRLI